MTNKANLRIGSLMALEMARLLILMMAASAAAASNSIDEVALSNITRSASGDYFSLKGIMFLHFQLFVLFKGKS